MKEMKGFKKFGSGYIDDLGVYVREYLEKFKHDEIKIYVGTDSESFRKCVSYATVVLFYHNGKGGHFIYKGDLIPKIKPKAMALNSVITFDAIRDMCPKLWGEVERTFEVAEYLEKELDGIYKRTEPMKKLVDVDLDLNPSKKWLSNLVYDAGVGYFVGMGYRVRTKPQAWAASTAADLVCRKKDMSRRSKRKNL